MQRRSVFKAVRSTLSSGLRLIKCDNAEVGDALDVWASLGDQVVGFKELLRNQQQC